MRVLVSGGCGRLGRPLVEWLRAAGAQVAAPARAEVDWTQPQQVCEAVRQHRPDRVLALASWTDVPGAQRDPAGCVRDTVLTTQVSLAAAGEAGVPLLYVSTDYVLAVLRGQAGAGVYAAAKLVAEQLVQLAGQHVAQVAFTSPEQVAGWRWANGYSLANRCWLDELVPQLGRWCMAQQVAQLVQLGGAQTCTPAQLLATRYPLHPALAKIVESAEDAASLGLTVQPADTRW